MLPAYIISVLLLATLPLGAQQPVTGVERIVAVGDVHGDLDQLLSVLRSAKVIDKKNKWIGGKTHLVQTGDLPDRGPSTRKIMDLMMDLEKQAAKAGGKVHALIGNHEAMNLYGDLRYVIPEEFASFRTGDSEALRDAWFEQELPALRQAIVAKGEKPDDAQIRKQFNDAHPPGWVEHRQAFGPKGKYGKWIREHAAVAIVNDLLFLHGGIGPKYGTRTITEINDQVRAELEDFSKIEGGIVIDPEGPLWYRGLAREPEGQLSAHVDQLLQFHKVSAVVIGHTPTAGAVLTRFGGKVIMIDVGLSKYYGGPPACLVVEGSKRFALHRGTLLPLPSNPQEMVAYLKRAAALDPQPSPLQKLISGSSLEATKDDPQ